MKRRRTGLIAIGLALLAGAGCDVSDLPQAPRTLTVAVPRDLSTLDPAADTWAGTIGSHVHYNVGFNREGLYQLVLRATLTNDGSGSITAGTYTEEETFLFAVGDSSIAAVPEPGTLVAVGSLMATMGWRRRRARMG